MADQSPPNPDQVPPASSAADALPQQQKCPVCQKMNRVGVMFCENCGSSLSGDRGVIRTKQFTGGAPATGLLNANDDQRSETAVGMEPPANAQIPANIPAPNVIAQVVQSAGTDAFTETMMLRLEIEGFPTPILIYPKSETTLGRRDPATGTMPEVDLTAYAGYRQGVSRRHAVLRLKSRQLEIYDLGSSNGTHVNGVRLTPHKPITLRDGDEIALGKMIIRALFQDGGRL